MVGKSPTFLVSVALLPVALLVSACTAAPAPSSPASPLAASSGTARPEVTPSGSPMAGTPFRMAILGTFDEPWAMTFLPGGDALITERGGTLVLRRPDGGTLDVRGVPAVVHAGQGGLGDVLASPTFAQDRTVYLSWAASGDGGTGAEVGRATFVDEGSTARLDGLTVIWRQQPKTSGSGHFGHRLAFSPDGRFLFVSSGERQKFDPAQDPDSDLGKIIRMNPDGSGARHWTSGHRNPLGIAFDPAGNLWSSEMGPQGGDELNLIVEGRNYGWPKASNGSHYGGAPIPDHSAGDGFEAPKVWWNPSVSPGSLMIYSGTEFPDWRGDAFIGALSAQALIRVDVDGTRATKAEQWQFGNRVRAVNQAPDGSIWVLEDGANAQLLRLSKS